jgi:hypothetical protein
MKKKTKKKQMVKRRNQKNNKKAASNRMRKQGTYSSNGTEHSKVPCFSDIKAPEGYMIVSSSQAMMKYGEPVMEVLESKKLEDINEVFGVVTLIWNYTIALNNRLLERDFKKEKADTVRAIRKILLMNKSEAEDFLELMIERRHKLLPYDIQPHGTMTMCMLKEKEYKIEAFDYSLIKKADKPYAVTKDDNDLRDDLNKFDLKVLNLDYDEWEKDFFEMSERCEVSYEKWLNFYKIEGYKEEFPNDLHILIDFIYRYGRDENPSLRKISYDIFDEFFSDFLLRKVMADPDEYPRWFPCIKLFYEYLQDIGYVENLDEIRKILSDIEPDFINLLKIRY